MRENSGSDNKRQRKENILDESSSEESSSDRRGDKPSELIPSGSGRTGPRSGTLSRRQFLGGMGAAAVVAAVGCGDSSPSGVDIDGGPDEHDGGIVDGRVVDGGNGDGGTHNGPDGGVECDNEPIEPEPVEPSEPVLVGAAYDDSDGTLNFEVPYDIPYDPDLDLWLLLLFGGSDELPTFANWQGLSEDEELKHTGEVSVDWGTIRAKVYRLRRELNIGEPIQITNMHSFGCVAKAAVLFGIKGFRHDPRSVDSAFQIGGSSNPSEVALETLAGDAVLAAATRYQTMTQPNVAGVTLDNLDSRVPYGFGIVEESNSSLPVRAERDNNTSHKGLVALALRPGNDLIPPLPCYNNPQPGTPANSIEHREFTFRFESQALTGRYVLGDPIVVSPVRITQMEPDSFFYADEENAAVHGAMFDPGRSSGLDGPQRQGFDSRLGRHGDLIYEGGAHKYYAGRINCDPAMSGRPVDVPVHREVSIMKMRSVLPHAGTRSVTRGASCLTVVRTLPPANAFRPAYCCADKTARWTTDDVDLGFLQNLSAPSTSPDFETLIRYVGSPHQHAWTNGALQNCNPLDNQHSNGREYGRHAADVGLALNTDALTEQEKWDLSLHAIQQGIDIYGRLMEGATWSDDGQLNIGRYFYLLFAGLALQDSDILAWANVSDTSLWRRSHRLRDSALGPLFQEHRQTFYVSEADLDPDQRETPYPSYMLGHPEWGVFPTGQPWANRYTQHASYRNNNIPHQVGFAVIAHIMPGFYEHMDSVAAATHAKGPGVAALDYVDFRRDWWYANAGTGTNSAPLYHRDMYDLYRSLGPRPNYGTAADHGVDSWSY